MKKFLIIASAVAVAAGCAKVTTVDTDGPKEIAFEAYNYAATKVPLNQVSGLDEDYDMPVHAIYRTGSDQNYSYTAYFDDAAGYATFTHDNNIWSGNKYWPSNGELSFNAITPAKVGEDEVLSSVQFSYTDNNNSNNAITNITATMSDNSSVQADVMVAQTSSFQNQKGTQNNVSMTFKHALAQVVVTAKANEDNLVTINSITLKGTKQSGKLTAEPTNSDVKFTWVDIEQQTTPEMKYNVSETGDALTTEPKTYTGILVRPETALGNNHQLVVEYTIKGSVKQTYTIDLSSIKTANTDDATISKWEEGKKYIYNLTVSPEEIKIDPTVSDWTSDDTTTGNTTVGGSN